MLQKFSYFEINHYKIQFEKGTMICTISHKDISTTRAMTLYITDNITKMTQTTIVLLTLEINKLGINSLIFGTSFNFYLIVFLFMFVGMKLQLAIIVIKTM